MISDTTTTTATQQIDPILDPKMGRLSLMPVSDMVYPEFYEMYEKQVACFWTKSEIDITADVQHWAMLSEDEKYFISHILAFFAQSDGIVIENLMSRVTNEVKLPEAKAFYAFQAAMETIHNEVYGELINTYISDATERKKLNNAIDHFTTIKNKADWAIKWIEDKDAIFDARVIAFAIIEGIFFSGSFCAIYWLKERGIMPGLTFSNELISRDEGLHCDFACLMHSKLINKISNETISGMVRDAVEIEKEFIIESLPVRLIGMNADIMSRYIEFVANRLLNELGCDSLWDIRECPFDFMQKISVQGKTNFFERRVGEYQKSGVMASAEESHEFTTDMEF